MQYAYFRRRFNFCLPLYLVLVQNVAQSDIRLTPSLEIEETFLSNKTSSLDESGQITRISPGILYEASGPKANMSLSYFLDAREYNKLSQDDNVEQSLIFRSEIDHVPNHWNSYLTSTIKQANVSPDAIQIVNPDIQSDNTREFRTLGIGTSSLGRWFNDIDYESQLNADYADFEDGEDTDSVELILGLNNSNTQQNINWRTTFTSTVLSTPGEDEQIDAVQAEFNYRFNLRYSAFLTVDKSESDNDFLNDTNTLVGILWTPNRVSSFRLGSGKRGNDTTYTLDSQIVSKRVTYAINYGETITTLRTLLIEQVNDEEGFFTTSQTLSINPVLIKNGRITINLAGRRTDMVLSYFEQTTDRSDAGDDSEKTEGLSINISRRLSTLSSVQINLSRRESKITQQNTIDDYSLSYSRQLSKKATLSVGLRVTEQTSGIIENEYEQNSLNIKINTTF